MARECCASKDAEHLWLSTANPVAADSDYLTSGFLDVLNYKNLDSARP